MLMLMLIFMVQPPGPRPLLSWPCLANSSAAVELLQVKLRMEFGMEFRDGLVMMEFEKFSPPSLPEDGWNLGWNLGWIGDDGDGI